MKKSILLALFLAFASACSPQTRQLVTEQPQIIQKKAVSYRLEDLCDTEISERDLTLHVYIAPSNRLWDYQEYRDELSDYIKEFFREQKVNCNIAYSNSGFSSFNARNEFGVEILDSRNDVIKRCFEIFPITDEAERNKKIKNLRVSKGTSITQKNIILINGCWEEFRESTSRAEDEKWFSEKYAGVTVKEYVLRLSAATICHEVLHCFGLFHPGTFNPDFIPLFIKGVPNIMINYYPPKFTKENKTGYSITDFQGKFVHSYLAGNNAYKAFSASGKNLDIFAENIAKSNNIRVTEGVIMIPNYP